MRVKPRKDRAGYLFLLPWFVGMLFTVIPFFADGRLRSREVADLAGEVAVLRNGWLP